MTIDRAATARWLIDRHFIGSAFGDALFHTENTVREKACSWKIMSSMRHFSPLSNQGWRWKAVGIPLNLLDSTLQGDIDLLFALLIPPRTENGRRVLPPPIYRCFELKTPKVNRDGDVQSLKTAKFHKTMGQLEKLCDIGAQQVFLLEAFIVEAGYSDAMPTREMPMLVREAVAEKYEQIMRADYGYVAMAIEQVRGYAEEAVTQRWPTMTVKSAKINKAHGPFLDVVTAVEDYINHSGATAALM